VTAPAGQLGAGGLGPLGPVDPSGVEPTSLEPVGVDQIESVAVSAMELLNGYAHIFVAAFLVTLLATPLVRRVAVAANVVDRPDETRKLHRYPVAYLGGVAVFLGVLVAIGLSYVTADPVADRFLPVPIAIIIGMVAIMFTGLADDVWGWDPRLKIAGQLVAAAALAINDIGVRVAEGALTPIMGGPDEVIISIAGWHLLNGHLFYWTGTAIIAIFVLGGCNASNLLDGLDGLLSGVVGIAAVGLLAICLLVAPLDRRTVDRDAAEAAVTVATVQAAVDDVRAETGRPPPSLAALVRLEVIERVPETPPGWPLRYDASAGVVSAPDDRVRSARNITSHVRGQVMRYRDADERGRFPVGLEALVTVGLLDETPKMPAGYRLRYDPNLGHVGLEGGEASLVGARIVLCLAILGAVIGFLPHNFNPASIFLGDCGSLLLGYMCVATILMLGERGQTYLVTAGLIVFAVPIMDTTLAILRRRLTGTSLSVADHHHIHHQLKRALGGVKRAVFALYGIASLFAFVGVTLVALVSIGLRVRFIYAIALVLFSFIAVVAVKVAIFQKLMLSAEGAGARPARSDPGVGLAASPARDHNRKDGDEEKLKPSA
jgi:UDP-N-acetylmuramyl pentapeptide phosphotransferase/UDP-N-acetylglucosamine-1-phosphate transferase